MKKALLIITIFSFMLTRINAQLPMDANTPILMAIESLNSINNEVNNIMSSKTVEMAKDLKDKVNTDWIETYQSLKTISDLLESFVCQSEDINIKRNISSNYGNCMIDLRFNMAAANMKISSDILKAVFIGKNLLKIEAGTRNQILQGVIKALQDAMYQMEDLKKILNNEIDMMILNEYNNKIEKLKKEESKLIFTTNRYHR